MTIKSFWSGPPSSANFVDKGKNTSQQRDTLPIPQVPIRLTNVWYSRLDGIMDPLPSKVWLVLDCFKAQEHKMA